MAFLEARGIVKTYLVGGTSLAVLRDLDLQVDAGIVQAARFLAFGCPHTIAVAAWIAEHAPGGELLAALPESVAQLSERFAVPVEKRGRLLIIEDAWLACVRRGEPPVHRGNH